MGLTGSEQEFPERYESACRQWFGKSRIHIQTAWRKPFNLRIGDHVMYLPLEVTEQYDMVPRMAQVRRIINGNDSKIHITTNLGVMVFGKDDQVQVVT